MRIRIGPPNNTASADLQRRPDEKRTTNIFCSLLGPELPPIRR